MPRSRPATGPTVYLRDVGTITDTTDIVVGYAHVDGKRTVYIPVTKRADASTLDVIRRVRQALPAMRSVAPEDVEDRPGVRPVALRRRAPSHGLVGEGLLGAFLTGLDGPALPARLAQLADRGHHDSLRAARPPSSRSGLTGQTINIMTLGGLALAVGVLVDEATVEIENIHTSFAGGLSRARAVLEASREDGHRAAALHVVRAGGVPAVASS